MFKLLSCCWNEEGGAAGNKGTEDEHEGSKEWQKVDSEMETGAGKGSWVGERLEDAET